MYITNDTAPAMGLRPGSSAISRNDWSILSRFWYPVAVVGDVRQTPVAAKLLDVELVVYRSGGTVVVARDICPHRSVRMSAGRIIDDTIVCRYHGMRFDAAGRCTKIPALGRDARIPASYSLFMVRSEIKYGLLWACLDADSTETVPELPSLSNSDTARHLHCQAEIWPASAGRMIENTIDLAHIPFVHENSMGIDVPVPTDGHLTHTNEGITYTGVIRERRMDDGEISRVDMNYTLVLPFVLELYSHVLPENFLRLHAHFFPTPVDAHHCMVFQILILPDGAQVPDFSLPIEGEGAQILSEDIDTLQHLALQDIPLDRCAEKIDIPGDKFTIEYRQRLRKLGLGRSDTLMAAE